METMIVKDKHISKNIIWISIILSRWLNLCHLRKRTESEKIRIQVKTHLLLIQLIRKMFKKLKIKIKLLKVKTNNKKKQKMKRLKRYRKY